MMNKDQYIKNLLKEATPLSDREVACVDLSDKSPLWIEEGVVNVFYAEEKSDGVFIGREFLAEFNSGDLLFPAWPLKNKERACKLIAQALPDSRIFRLNRNWRDLFVNSELLDESIRQLESWLSALSKSLRSEDLHLSRQIINDQDFDSKQKIIDIPDDTSFRSESSLLWVTVDSGSCTLFGGEETPLLKAGESFTLPRNLCLTTREATSIKLQNTDEVAASSKFEELIEEFYKHLFKSISQTKLLHQDESRLKNAKLVEMEDRALRTAIDDLAAIANEKECEVSASPESLIDPCMAVLDVAGRACDVPFIFPRDIPKCSSNRLLLRELLDYAAVYHRQVELNQGWWKRETGNMVAIHGEEQTPVALLYQRGQGYRVFDPISDRIKPLTKEFARELEPEAFVLYRQFPSEPIKGKDFIMFMMKDLKPEFRLALIVGLFGGIIAMAPTYMTSFIFNSVIPKADSFQLFQIGVILISAAFTSTIFNLLRSYIMIRVKTLSDCQSQAAVTGRMLRLPMSVFNKYSTGDFAQRVMGVDSIRTLLTDSSVQSITTLMFASPNLILMFYYSWKLSAIGLALGFVLFAVIAVVGFLNYLNKREEIKIKGELSGFVLQTLNGIQKIRNSGSEDRIYVKWAHRFRQQVDYYIRSIRVNNFLSVFNSFYPVLISGVFFYCVGRQWRGSMDIGNYLAFNAAFTSIISAMTAFAAVIPAIMSIFPLYQRLEPILKTPTETDESMKAPGPLDGEARIDNVSFRYQPDAPLVLNNVTINANPGEFIAIVGPSGAGKSTLVRLLLGFDEPERGGVFYSGHDLSAVDKRKLRRQLGVVLQNVGLSFGSIYNNIAGASGASVEQAWEAAKLACVDQDIREMPMGMHTVVGNGTLSVGQKQRLLIARALIKKPKIVIFDEATSALDNVAQSIVTDSLRKLDSTRIVIAHRLSSIEKADRIFVMDAGKVVQTGTFEELIQQPGLFQRLAKRQMVEK